MQETWVQSLGQEDPLEKEMATHSNILPWEIPWTEEAGGLSPSDRKRVTWASEENNNRHNPESVPTHGALEDTEK